MMAPKVAVPMPPSWKLPKCRLKSPAPRISVTAATMRLPFWLKSTWWSTQKRAPATVIRPNTTMDTPPSTAGGMVEMAAPNLGEKPSRMAASAAITKISVE